MIKSKEAVAVAKTALVKLATANPDRISAGGSKASNLQGKMFTGADAQLYSSARLGTNLTELINESTDKQVGITNLENGKPKKGEDYGIGGLRLGYGVIAAADNDTKPEEVDYKTNGTIPAWLRNAELQIRVEGANVLDEYPVANFFSGAAAQSGDEAIHVLGEGFAVAGGSKVEAFIKVPADADLGADKHYCRIDFVGYMNK